MGSGLIEQLQMSCKHSYIEVGNSCEIKRGEIILSLNDIEDMHAYDNVQIRINSIMVCANCNHKKKVIGDWESNLYA